MEGIPRVGLKRETDYSGSLVPDKAQRFDRHQYNLSVEFPQIRLPVIEKYGATLVDANTKAAGPRIVTERSRKIGKYETQHGRKGSTESSGCI